MMIGAKRSKLIKFSGTWNIGAGVALLFFPAYPWIGLNIPVTWGILLAALLFYTAATLIIGSRDLERYGSILIHEALLRFLAAIILITSYIFSEAYNFLVFFAGVTDAMWGLVYCYIVPNATGRSLLQLLKNEEPNSLSNASQHLSPSL